MKFIRTGKAGNTAKKPRPRAQFDLRGRLMLVGGALALCSLGLVVRAVDLQLVDNAFYQRQADARFLREVPIPTSRGTYMNSLPASAGRIRSTCSTLRPLRSRITPCAPAVPLNHSLTPPPTPPSPRSPSSL